MYEAPVDDALYEAPKDDGMYEPVDNTPPNTMVCCHVTEDLAGA